MSGDDGQPRKKIGSEIRAAIARGRSPTLSRIAATVSEHRQIVLFLSDAALAVAQPFADVEWADAIRDILLVIVFVTGMAVVGRNRWFLLIALGLGIPALVATILEFALGEEQQRAFVLDLLQPATSFVFLIVLAGIVLFNLLRLTEVEADHLAGMATVYLLLGVAWAALYGLIDAAVPEAFSYAKEIPGDRYSLHSYFSFVTLSTLGYGDITPLHGAARSAAWLEALVGQLFVAIMIGRFVSIYRSPRQRRGGFESGARQDRTTREAGRHRDLPDRADASPTEERVRTTRKRRCRASGRALSQRSRRGLI